MVRKGVSGNGPVEAMNRELGDISGRHVAKASGCATAERELRSSETFPVILQLPYSGKIDLHHESGKNR